MTKSVTPLPTDMPLEEWSARLRDDLRSLDILVYTPDQDWRDWGNRVVTIAVPLRGAPLTNGYPIWQKWAMDVIQVCGL